MQFDPNSDFYRCDNLEVYELGEDDCFVTKGSQGTSLNSRRKSAKPKPEKLLDLGLLRVQFTGKLSSHYKFCHAALKQALDAANDFLGTHSDLQSHYSSLIASGIKEEMCYICHCDSINRMS